MNRKNLTAAVLAGLAGVAGLAATAQAVNLNPDGLGQVLIYPYYNTNDGNQTILSVVNTTDQAKAVKVRFHEGYNSREVLDFNLYLSMYDVWVAAAADDGAGTPTLYIPDTSCTVPYLYGNSVEAGETMGVQEFLPYAYTGDYEDGGPTDISRAAEGYFAMIEMGVLTNDSARAATTKLPKRIGSADAVTHGLNEDGESVPENCQQLVDNWTEYGGAKPDPMDGMWFDEAEASASGWQATTDTKRNRGGLFGGAAVVNTANGTMFSYDAKAIQGYDKSVDGVHAVPGTIHPSMDDGDQKTATIFFGTPSNEAVDLFYSRSIGAISAVFMHDNVMNEFTTEEDLFASTDWVFTFPTKAFYVDSDKTGVSVEYIPDAGDPGCNFWEPGDFYPPGDKDGVIDPIKYPSWATCDYVKVTYGNIIPPFTDSFDGKACETVYFTDWDREESPSNPTTPGNNPPIVSPPPPGGTTPKGPPPFQLCYETNVLRFGDGVVFDSDLLATVTNIPADGWAKISMSLKATKAGNGLSIGDEMHQDENGLVGLPVTGFAAQEYENEYLTGGVIAHYGGLFQHKSSVKRIEPERCYHFDCSD